MPYCNTGDKPTVEYQFASSPKRKYKSLFSPIDIELTQVPNNSDGSGDNVLYEITLQYWSGATSTTQCGQPSNVISKVQAWGSIGEITGCTPICGSGSGSTQPYIYLRCRGQGVRPGISEIYEIPVPGAPSYTFAQMENPQILSVKKISSFSDPTDLDCKITISYRGKTLFSDVGKCPMSFNVLCREPCPEGTCCECDCGSVICCYGSDGQVLKTIRK